MEMLGVRSTNSLIVIVEIVVQLTATTWASTLLLHFTLCRCHAVEKLHKTCGDSSRRKREKRARPAQEKAEFEQVSR